jgi:hypothetical protein
MCRISFCAFWLLDSSSLIQCLTQMPCYYYCCNREELLIAGAWFQSQVKVSLDVFSLSTWVFTAICLSFSWGSIHVCRCLRVCDKQHLFISALCRDLHTSMWADTSLDWLTELCSVGMEKEETYFYALETVILLCNRSVADRLAGKMCLNSVWNIFHFQIFVQNS